jgi:hypothetical protein
LRALVLGERARERDALARWLAGAGVRVRAERAFDARPTSGVGEQVVLDASDAAQVIEAARGCNVLYHVARPVDPESGAAVARALIRAARESEVTRVIAVSDARTLLPSAAGVTARDRGLPGGGWAPPTEGLYVYERALARAAADGLHASVLLPGYVWHEGEENAMPEVRPGLGRLSVTGAGVMGAVLLAMARSARAGARYTLGGVDTWAEEFGAWLEARGELGGEDAGQLAAASGDRWLAPGEAPGDLRVRLPTDLARLGRGM